jgi:transcriptional regulator with XRE-family HTH domain
MIQENLNLKNVLIKKFTQAKAKNSNYSIRAFAKKVGVSPGSLSLIMLGKRAPSSKLSDLIAKNLHLDPQERSEVIPKPVVYKTRNKGFDTYMQLTSDQFDLISQWHFFAILNLIHLKNFKSNSTWIAKRLGLSKEKIDESIELLLRLNLIAFDDSGKMIRKNQSIRTQDDIKNEALRLSHLESLDLAKKRLADCDVHNRDYTWVTFPFDLKKMDKAKELIRRFQDEFLGLISEDSDPDNVYRMAIQLYPLTNVSENL